MYGEPVRSTDEGFSVVELIVALAVVSGAMAGLGAFFVNSGNAVAHQRDQRQAVQVAATAIEQVRGLKGSSLLSGRSALKVREQWDAALAGTSRPKIKRYLDSMQRVSDPGIEDPASTAGAAAAVSTATQTIRVGGAVFQRNIYVGRCDIYYMRTDDCVNPEIGTPPANTAEILKYFRVVVLVTWPGKSCPSRTCSYLTSTLIASEPTEPTFDSKAGVPSLVTTDMWFYVGKQRTRRLDVDHGQQPNVWSHGTLPSWLTISATNGLVTGTPTAVGEPKTTVTVTDALGRSDSGTVTWHAVLPPTITVPPHSTSRAGEAVNLKVTAAQGIPALVFTSADLPAELDIDSTDGTVTGTLTQPGDYRFTVTVTDAEGEEAEGVITHTVVDPTTALAFTSPSPADRTSAVGADTTLTFETNADLLLLKNISYEATGLPPGLKWNNGKDAIVGKPTTAGTYLVTVTATSKLPVVQTATLTFVWTIS